MKNIIFIPVLALLLTGCAGDEAKLDQAKFYDDIRTSNTPESMFRIAESMRQTGNYDSAISIYKQVLQNDPNNADIYIGISQSLRGSGRIDAALEMLTSRPSAVSSKKIYQELGNIYSAKQNPRKCARAYMEAYDRDKDDLFTLNGLAVCHDLMGNHTQAEKWYRLALSKSPSNEKLKSNLGLSLALAGKTNEAIRVLNEVVKSPDATPRDRQNLAMAYGLSGNLEEAAKTFSLDLNKEAVQANLAFIHKMSQTKQVIPQQPVSKIIESGLENTGTSDTSGPKKDEETPLAGTTSSDFWSSVEKEIEDTSPSES